MIFIRVLLILKIICISNNRRMDYMYKWFLNQRFCPPEGILQCLEASIVTTGKGREWRENYWHLISRGQEGSKTSYNTQAIPAAKSYQ